MTVDELARAFVVPTQARWTEGDAEALRRRLARPQDPRASPRGLR